MKVGDLVKANSRWIEPALRGWLGIVLEFDDDDDPVVQWFEDGELMSEPVAEYRTAVKIL